MTQRTEIVIAIAIGATIGVTLMFASFAFASYWYGTAVTPLVLILAPGGFVALFNPTNPDVYWIAFAVIQVAYYSLVVFFWRKLINTFRLKKENNAG